MIIADSNMSMSSRRHYSQKVSSGMVAAGSSGNSFSFGMSQARSSLSQKESYLVILLIIQAESMTTCF